ncbi:MAG: DNA mismatch repair endonuclease MutL [Oscillospiraceae bacterium]|nr:DNA mismatch repair endonuclease MutL [Oscillospiraceae bacterium]
MPEIHVLPKDIAELIAAGEVIERPASVLKELTENAIDAGAKRITAELKRGGVLYLRVTDDGCGIAPEQVKTAFLRHATSKIQTAEDLETIFTLGFRGEALASICAVSRMEILTRQKGAEYGTHYALEGGEETAFEQSGCPEGTTVVVRDLFYNVPVRAGFLKKDTAEGNAAANIFQKIALSHPEISFRLIRENKTEFVTPGDGELFSAVYAIFGKDFARDLLPVKYSETENGGISVEGYVMKPLYSRPNRAHQLFFVNGRSVRSFTLISAIEEAYKTLIMTGKYPACVLMIRVSPRIVDVNMHPTKAEVRFSDEKRIYNAVYFAVLSALEQNHLVYEFQLPQPEQPRTSEKPVPPVQPKITPQIYTPQRPQRDWHAPVAGSDDNTPAPLFAKKAVPASEMVPPKPDAPQTAKADSAVPAPVRKPEPEAETVSVPPVIPESLKAFPDLIAQPAVPVRPMPAEVPARPMPAAPPESEPAAPAVLPEEPEARNAAISEIQREKITVIGELFDNYVLAQAGEQFVMIDKHAAHERILFERFRTRECRDRQSLLTPVRVLLTADEISALQDMEETLLGCGFTFDFSESPVVQLTGVPLSCTELDLDQIAADLAANCAKQQSQPDLHLLDDMFHDLACKAAIRAGTHNTKEELQSLAVQVWENEQIRHCPHGRPVLFLLSKYQIEKQFKRIQN